MNMKIVIFTVAAAAIWALVQGFKVTIPILSPIAIVALGAGMIHFRDEKFRLCLISLFQIVLFSTGFVILTYLGATLNRPLIDEYLARFDAMLGFHGVQNSILDIAYDTLLIQTALVVAILGFANDRKQLETFVSRMMIAAYITLVLFMLFPAQGRLTNSTNAQAFILEQFNVLRSGALNKMDLSNVTGLIAFPSFHTIWAVLITVALVHRPWVCVPFFVLNIFVIRSTLTTGGHYLTDVLAGGVVCLIVLLWHQKSRVETKDERIS
jgi:hypothetical protein